MSTKCPYSPKELDKLLRIYQDPDVALDLQRFVVAQYSWGATGPLVGIKGPRRWQANFLDDYSQHIADNIAREKRGESPEVYKASTVGGRAPGKTAVLAWLADHSLSCWWGSTVIISANKESQLRDKTFAELGVWRPLANNAEMFDLEGLALKPQAWWAHELETQLKIGTRYYYAKGELWDEKNPSAYAGAHSHYGTTYLWDEAPEIPKPIWTVADGGLSKLIPHRAWFVFGNGRANSGPFYDTHHKDRDEWRRYNIDSRTVEGIDQKKNNAMVAKLGEEHDDVRSEIRGLFRKHGTLNFIGRGLIREAMGRAFTAQQREANRWAPKIMGIDVSRGGDNTVFAWRQGRDGRVHAPVVINSDDTMVITGEALTHIRRTNPDAICIDMGNVGAAVYDRLRELGIRRIYPVWFGAPSKVKGLLNVRMEIWYALREWMGEEEGACGVLPDIQDLEDDLAGPERRYQSNGTMYLEAKEDMEARGLHSPDTGDAYACTFAKDVPSHDLRSVRGPDADPEGPWTRGGARAGRPRQEHMCRGVEDYDPLDSGER